MSKGPWYYESDGERHARTHYCWRHNSEAKGGIERKDFERMADALKLANTQWHYGGPTLPHDGTFYAWRPDWEGGRMFIKEKRIFDTEEAARQFVKTQNA